MYRRAMIVTNYRVHCTGCIMTAKTNCRLFLSYIAESRLKVKSIEDMMD